MVEQTGVCGSFRETQLITNSMNFCLLIFMVGSCRGSSFAWLQGIALTGSGTSEGIWLRFSCLAVGLWWCLLAYAR